MAEFQACSHIHVCQVNGDCKSAVGANVTPLIDWRPVKVTLCFGWDTPLRPQIGYALKRMDRFEYKKFVSGPWAIQFNRQCRPKQLETNRLTSWEHLTALWRWSGAAFFAMIQNIHKGICTGTSTANKMFLRVNIVAVRWCHLLQIRTLIEQQC